jgi:type II secretory pathway component PulF
MTSDELIALNDQIAGMAKAGLPLDQGLASLAREMGHGRLRAVTAAMARDLDAGVPLPEAVERQKNDLPPFYAHLVTAGIRTGRLPDVLATLTTYARTIAATRSIVVEALFYPAVVLSVSVVLIGALILYVLPMFVSIYDDFHMRIPDVTAAVLFVGRHPIPWIAIPAGLAAVAALTWVVLRNTAQGRQTLARIVYGMPIIGTLVRSARLGAFAELLAILVEFEMPLPEAVRLAGIASSDPLIASRIGVVHDRLAHGAAFGTALGGLGLLPEWVTWMAGAGEQRGGLAPALRQIAALYRRQVEARAAILRTVLPAFLIIVTAAVPVGVIVLTVLPPMFNLIDGLTR